MTRMPGGRPPPSIVTANFTQLEKVDNRSNRYWWKCNHCTSGAGAHIQGRDNNHIKHLTDAKKCPNCPPGIRKEARIFLAGRGVKDMFLDPITAVPSCSGNESSSSVIAIKRKRPDTLDGFVDYPLAEAQQVRANVKLFRFIVHANIAFATTENWYFRDFLNEL